MPTLSRTRVLPAGRVRSRSSWPDEAPGRGPAPRAALTPSGGLGPAAWAGAPAALAAPELLRLQRLSGNAAVAGALAPYLGAARVQRDITVTGTGPKPEKQAPGYWTNQYCNVNKAAIWGRVRSAMVMIESTGEVFPTVDLLFERCAEVVEANKNEAIRPVWREPLATRVAIALDYHFGALEQKPALTFAETYETSWDTTGGWGAEYWPPLEGGTPLWVVHVHRGPNGGLKAARVKTYEERKLKEKGMSVLKFEHLNALGVKTVDTTRTH